MKSSRPGSQGLGEAGYVAELVATAEGLLLPRRDQAIDDAGLGGERVGQGVEHLGRRGVDVDAEPAFGWQDRDEAVEAGKQGRCHAVHEQQLAGA